MKTIKYISLLTNLIISLSCVQTDDFDLPKIEIQEPDIVVNTTINAIKKAYDQSGEKILTFDTNNDSIFESFVISSDESGNFYKLLILQDKHENPTSGIEILIDLKTYYTKYNFGRKVFIKIAGMSITNENGKYKMGLLDRNQVNEIPESLINDYIIRSSKTEEIIPKQLQFSDFSKENLNTYLQLKNVQFQYDEIGKTIAGEPYDKYSAERKLIQCDNQITTTLSTSTYAKFKSFLIPEKNGLLSAVFTMDFYSEKYVFVLNNLSTIDFTDEKRCDPYFLNCDGNTDSNQILFYENFENIKKTEDLNDLGWTNINANLGNVKFKKRTVNTNGVMRISAYNTQENPLEAWLITPKINLDNTLDAILTFQTNASYDNGTILTAWVSTDFKGDVKNASWQQLNVKISVGPTNTFTSEFTNSGKISLSCLTGDVYIAFKYLGGDPGITTTYDLDNVKIMVK
ncbi:MAG: DUF5689 domain-containing protein [Bacteroidota bacterium]